MDRALIHAHGKALALLATILHRAGVVPAAEFGDLMAEFSEIEVDSDQAAILAIWAATIREAADLTDPYPGEEVGIG